MCIVDITGHDNGKIFENKTFNVHILGCDRLSQTLSKYAKAIKISSADKSMKEVVYKNSYTYVVIYTSMTNHI